MTNNLQRRIRQHNLKQNKSTKPYIPWRIVYSESYNTRIEARNREKFLKTGIGRDYIKTLLNSQ
ncbi:MAG: GIY-YIG nuclease family protein [Flavobacteriaceae bacterium]|nr:GIY-YIG nuclease family protein [Flavobacteriaceae bacterium]